MSIGTLMAYTLVAASVMILRFRPAPTDLDQAKDESSASIGDYFKKSTCPVPTEKSSGIVANLASLFSKLLISLILRLKTILSTRVNCPRILREQNGI